MKKNKFVSNTYWILISQVFYLGLSFLISAYAGRILGPQLIGIMDYSNNYISMLQLVCGLGLETVVVREIVKNREKTGVLLGSAFALQIGASLLAIFGFISILWLIHGKSLLVLVAFIQSLSLIFKLYSVYDLYYQSLLQSKRIVQVRCTTTLIIAVFKFLSLRYQPSLVNYVILTTVEHLLCLCMIASSFRKTGIRLTCGKSTSMMLVRDGHHFILSNLLVIIYTRMDKAILSAIKGTTALGVYSVAVLLAEMWTIVPNALITSARPALLALSNQDTVLFEKRLKLLFAAVFYMGLAVCLVFFVGSGLIIDILYGEAYRDAAVPMIILSFGSIFAMLGNARSIWIVSENKQRLTKIFTGAGAVVNLVLDLSLIPKYELLGIAYATLIAQVVVAVVMPLCFKDSRRCSVLILQAIFLQGIFK